MTDVKLLLLHKNTWNHLTMRKKWTHTHLKMLSVKCLFKFYLIYMYKEDLALSNLQGFICHKTQPNQILYIQYICMEGIWH